MVRKRKSFFFLSQFFQLILLSCSWLLHAVHKEGNLLASNFLGAFNFGNSISRQLLCSSYYWSLWNVSVAVVKWWRPRWLERKRYTNLLVCHSIPPLLVVGKCDKQCTKRLDQIGFSIKIQIYFLMLWNLMKKFFLLYQGNVKWYTLWTEHNFLICFRLTLTNKLEMKENQNLSL